METATAAEVIKGPECGSLQHCRCKRSCMIDALTYDDFFAPLFAHASSIASLTCCTPSPCRTEVKSVGPPSRIVAASRLMTSKEAPTCTARSVLLMTSKSDWVVPGPPFRGTCFGVSAIS